MGYKRVHILGGAGSGKTTLAKSIATHIQAPHHELDEIYYLDIAARVRRPPADRDALVEKLIAADTWVLEGIFWQPWVQPALDRADKIIILAIGELTRHKRVIARHLKLLREASPHERKYFFPTLIELLRNNRHYNRGPLPETIELTAPFSDKVSICTNNSEAAQLLGL